MTKEIVRWWKEQTQRGKHFLAALVPAGIIFLVASTLFALGKLSDGQYILGGGFITMGWMAVFSFIPYKHSSLLD